jgi:hypothetical protein
VQVCDTNCLQLVERSILSTLPKKCHDAEGTQLDDDFSSLNIANDTTAAASTTGTAATGTTATASVATGAGDTDVVNNVAVDVTADIIAVHRSQSLSALPAQEDTQVRYRNRYFLRVTNNVNVTV